MEGRTRRCRRQTARRARRRRPSRREGRAGRSPPPPPPQLRTPGRRGARAFRRSAICEAHVPLREVSSHRVPTNAASGAAQRGRRADPGPAPLRWRLTAAAAAGGAGAIVHGASSAASTSPCHHRRPRKPRSELLYHDLNAEQRTTLRPRQRRRPRIRRPAAVGPRRRRTAAPAAAERQPTASAAGPAPWRHGPPRRAPPQFAGRRDGARIARALRMRPKFARWLTPPSFAASRARRDAAVRHASAVPAADDAGRDAPRRPEYDVYAPEPGHVPPAIRAPPPRLRKPDRATAHRPCRPPPPLTPPSLCARRGR